MDSSAMISRYLSNQSPRAGLIALIDYYLSEAHRDRVAKGCPIAALSSESVRFPPAAKVRFEEGIERFRDAIAEALRKMGAPHPEELASSAVAEMVGALTLARAMPSKGSITFLFHSKEQLKRRLQLKAARG